MIPWADFENRLQNDVYEDVRISLHEHWLPWIEHGPSMTTLFAESPMLEVAHERQFVISQEGGNSSNFEVEHTGRIAGCLQCLDDHFQFFAIDDSHRPDSPCGDDVMYCWEPKVLLDQLPSLDLPPIHQQDPSCSSVATSDQLPVTPTSAVNKVAPLKAAITPDDNSEDGALSNDLEDQFERPTFMLPRAGSKAPVNAIRMQKDVLQRKRFDSKLSTEPISLGKKRSSQWMMDKHEDEVTAMMRSQSIASLRASFNMGSMTEASSSRWQRAQET